VPAIPIVARTGEGMQTLLSTVADVIAGEVATRPVQVLGVPQVREAVEVLMQSIDQVYPGIPNTRWLAIRLLDGDARIQQAILSGELNDLVASQQAAAARGSRKMAVQGQ
jgi:ferrous iron transport protein B